MYITIKNNVAGGVRYFSEAHGSIPLGGTASAITGNWFCGQVKGGGYVKFRWKTPKRLNHLFITVFILDIPSVTKATRCG